MTFEEIKTRLEPYADDIKPVPSAGWRDKDRVARLKRLWEDGHSASEIARMMGGGITRNAVIGKIHRLGLSGRVAKTGFREKTSRGVKRAYAERPDLRQRMSAIARDREASRRLERIARLLPTLPAAPIPQTEELFIPLDQRKGVIDLADNDCRWPIGDPGTEGFHFCARARHVGSYCEFHARKAYAAPLQRAPEAIHWNFPSPVKMSRRVA